MAAPDDSVQTASELKSKASKGALLVGGRTVLIRGIGLLGNLVLARLLTPEDFGALAVGLVVVAFSQLFSDGGFGAALVRGEAEPTRADLETMASFQLLVGVAAIVISALSAALLGGVAVVALVMVAAVPVLALRSPHRTVLERHLVYPPLVRAEVLEVVAYQLFAIGSVLLGAGVWGVAAASVVQAVAGAILLVRASGLGFVKPRLHKTNFLRLAPFGLRLQLLGLTAVALIQGLNVTIGLLGGLYAVGLWSFAARLIQPAQQIFETLRHVSYPAFARLKAVDEDLSQLASRALVWSAIGSGFVLVPLAAGVEPLIEFAFGLVWVPSSDAVVLSIVALMLAGPVSAAFLGFLLAEGFANVALTFGVSQAVVWLGVTAVGFENLGVTAAGAGALAAAVTQVAFYRFYAPSRTGLQFSLAPIAIPFAVSCVATGAGLLVQSETVGSSAVLRLVASGATGLGCYIVLLALFQRRQTVGLVQTIRGTLRVSS